MREDISNDERLLRGTCGGETISATSTDSWRRVCCPVRCRDLFRSQAILPFLPLCFFFLGGNLYRIARAFDAAAPDRWRLGIGYSACARSLHANSTASASSICTNSTWRPLDLSLDKRSARCSKTGLDRESQISEPYVFYNSRRYLFRDLDHARLLTESLVE